MKIKELEKVFADDFGSPIFPMLADYYYNENMTPNTLTTYGDNTPVGFEDSTATVSYTHLTLPTKRIV